MRPRNTYDPFFNTTSHGGRAAKKREWGEERKDSISLYFSDSNPDPIGGGGGRHEKIGKKRKQNLSNRARGTSSELLQLEKKKVSKEEEEKRFSYFSNIATFFVEGSGEA